MAYLRAQLRYLRCIDYASDNKYKLSKWKPIKKSTFKCDFVETKCSLGNITKRYIHMQIVEQKDEVKNKLDWRIMPDVHLLVIDSVASPQIIRKPTLDSASESSGIRFFMW